MKVFILSIISKKNRFFNRQQAKIQKGNKWMKLPLLNRMPNKPIFWQMIAWMWRECLMVFQLDIQKSFY